ncbi:hypothetical protein AJ80_02810 [Polytolypa hystricis UAMH7299]|uniref:PUM-HD domain-containing protein n=1 Tax=Polytolypa hystricis (strain UAMH7299) TaxID=1447883 RepID=A0A2B7YQB3_POLH7|nr:hypothetical protein AJ80_02810 [Polytolypa hystricis UAMH7299]
MSFKNGLSERLEELRFSSPRSPPASDSPFPSFPSSPRGSQPLYSQSSAFSSPFSPPLNQQKQVPAPASDVRAHLQRRFTTDSAKLAPWPSLFTTSQAAPPVPDLDLISSATHLHKSQLFEKKRQHIEYMREQKKRFEADMRLLDLHQERERQELEQIARDLAQTGLSGPVSEPTTPPEYRDAGFPTALSRPSRFSMSSTNAPNLFNVFGSKVMSPPNMNSTAITSPKQDTSAPQSMLGSRRNSEDDYLGGDSFSTYRPPSSLNRYSMPTTGFGPQFPSTTAATTNGFNGNSSNTLKAFRNTKYLFDNDEKSIKDEDRIPTPDIKSYLRLTDPDDKFPTLSRREDNSGLLSANSAALDLANSQTPASDSYANGHHHSARQSLPQSSLSMFNLDAYANGNGQGKEATTAFPSMNGNQPRHMSRHSVEVNFNHAAVTSPTNGIHTRPTSLSLSYSANDIPTSKTGFNAAVTPPHSHVEQYQTPNFAGRVPTTHGTPASPLSPGREDLGMQSFQSTLQASAPPFGPHLTMQVPSSVGSVTPTLGTFASNIYNYGMQPFVTSPVQANNPMFPQQGLNSFQASTYPATYPARPTHQTRRSESETTPVQFSRFNNAPLEQFQGELYGLCKDQHGCRFLQRKLEEQNPTHIQMIFAETHMHVVELMTDPFGNYLCQKLLEFSNDEQRTALVNNAAPQLVKIALNQHGTRALQKMIEFISTPEQTQTVINALRDHVVELVQDLNGNHVIQKCLNRLSAPDAQFIYDAVGGNCVAVGTHRHGCCVLQRCIDHASGEQKARLISQITNNAFTLVQDPFGNYVVQYILDLAEPHFIEPICRSFEGKISALSKQKFSSNVIEKCIRTAEVDARRALIVEMLVPAELEKMLRDSFANYVVQTAMDFSDPDTRNLLIEAIRPILPAIRQTPHGRRIAGKIMSLESQAPGQLNGSNSSGQLTPNDATANDQIAAYHQIHAFPNTVITQYSQPFGSISSETTNSSGSTRTNSESISSGSTVNSETTTTIFSPIPHQPVNGAFSFY